MTFQPRIPVILPRPGQALVHVALIHVTALAAAPAPPAPRMVAEDRDTEHQIVLRSGDGTKLITVSCTCRRRRRPYRPPFEARKLFPAADAQACWRAWHTERGISV